MNSTKRVSIFCAQFLIKQGFTSNKAHNFASKPYALMQMHSHGNESTGLDVVKTLKSCLLMLKMSPAKPASWP